MNNRDLRRYESFARVRDFGSQHTDAFPAASPGGKQFKALNAIIKELDEHVVMQSSGKSSAIQNATGKAEARAALREALLAISRNARAIALDTPGFADKFRLPPKGSDQVLLNAARTIAADAVPVADAFIKNEMPEDFLAQLDAHINALDEAMTGKNLSRETQVAATASMLAAFERGAKVVTLLDAIVRNKFDADPAMMAEWERATHVETPKPKPAPVTPPAPH